MSEITAFDTAVDKLAAELTEYAERQVAMGNATKTIVNGRTLYRFDDDTELEFPVNKEQGVSK